MTAAVIYAAKSTADLHGSIPTQLEDCRALAARDGLEVVAEFRDEAFSAFTGNRGPGLAAAQRKAEDCTPCALIVQHTDRLSRGDGVQAQHLGEIFFWASRHGVTIRSCQDDLLADPRLGPLMAAVAGMRNHEDSKRKSEATRAGKKREAAKGRPHGGIAPYGYRYEGRRESCRLAPDPFEAMIVRRIYAEYAAGESQIAILRRLNEDGVPTKRGAKRWAQGTLVAILRNPFYIGKVRHRGELYDGEHEPVIEPELWERVAALRTAADSRPGRGRGRRPTGRHLFVRGMLRCGHCGEAMVARSEGDRYICWGRRDYGPDYCGQKPVRREEIDSAALRYFEEVALDIEATREQFERVLDDKRAELDARRSQAAGDALKNTAARERIEGDYLGGALSSTRYERLTVRLDEEAAALEAQLAQLDSQERDLLAEADLGDAEAAMLGYLSDIRAAIVGDVRNAEGLEAVRAALAAVFDSFTLSHRFDDPDSGVWGIYQAPRSRMAGSVPGYGTDITDGLMLLPLVRAEHFIRYENPDLPWRPILRKIPLGQRANNYRTASATLALFGPISVGAGT